MELEYLIFSLRDALFVLADPGKRLYWLHLLSAAVIALIYFRFSANHRSLSEMTSKLLALPTGGTVQLAWTICFLR